MNIEHCFGFRAHDVRNSLFFFNEDEIIYITGALGIVQNIKSRDQKIFGGLEFGESSECHSDDVLSIDFFNGEISMVATGQRELKPTVHIWSPLDPSICYCSFQLPNVCREVSCLSFDPKGQYLVALGKDPKNTFYVFCIKTKSFLWICETSEEILFDICWNNESDQICLVGNKKIFFAFPELKKIQSVKFDSSKPNLDYYTTVSFTKKGKWIIGDSSGNLSLWKPSNSYKESVINIGKGSIMALRTSDKHDFICCSDSSGNAYILQQNGSSLKILRKFSFGVVIKGIDINCKGNLILGLKTGDIIYKEIMTSTKQSSKNLEQFYVTQSHFDGQVSDICLIDNRYFVSVGYDNRIMLWDIDFKTCEKQFNINDTREGLLQEFSKERIPYEFPPNQQGESVDYNVSNQQVAIGVRNGIISIRANPFRMDERIKDITMPFNSITHRLKYCAKFDYLACGNSDKKIYILNVNNNYSIHKTLSGMESIPIQIDWDTEDQYIQTVCENNDYIFYKVNSEEKLTDPTEVANKQWATITCKFGYYVQGIFLGSTDPDYINSACRSNDHKYMVSGDDDRLLNIYNYPVVSDSAQCKSF